MMDLLVAVAILSEDSLLEDLLMALAVSFPIP